ncbi:Rrf2 family transcriptional regulator%2C iron-sulfur cluster assembly transcription factor [Vibrio cholerae]|nr:Rrf2 family transcriptional regulator%2C iron-sulfur cluster assembly transcription factor [Vibrio cholerae]
MIAAVDESVDATKCNGKGDCQGGTRCLTHTLWRDLSSRITDFLNNITLGELMMDNEVLEVSDRQDLHLAVSQRVSQNNSNTVTIGAAPFGINVRS